MDYVLSMQSSEDKHEPNNRFGICSEREKRWNEQIFSQESRHALFYCIVEIHPAGLDVFRVIVS